MADKMITSATLAGKNQSQSPQSVSPPVPAHQAFDRDGNPINVVVVQAKSPAEIHAEEFHAAERAREAADKASSYTTYQGRSDNAHVIADLKAKVAALVAEIGKLADQVAVSDEVAPAPIVLKSNPDRVRDFDEGV